ncbi:araC-like ligand binding domain protein [Paraburkholderia fungorum]|uniref:AraC-like ligand binding domain protein n=1 Tax=Paraburkholderia fungorum TaxID=134537 RepID=A0AAU8T2I0_9BURK|nr:AraC family ligand binding domain-containing protein [Paraburkholderia fungorum]AJZ60209.1 araC-like ligand binding domain protein [Paraburkholderia fungorum]
MQELKREFERRRAIFVDQTAKRARENLYWEPVVILREEIDAEVGRLATLPVPPDGRRQSLIVHPSARNGSPGLAPGIQVMLQVLLPGESTAPMRHNATEVNFCILGSGKTTVAGRTIAFKQYDVWNHPSYSTYSHCNDSSEIQVRLTYSNIALLQHMEIYVPDYEPPVAAERGETALQHIADPKRQNPYGMFPIGDDGGLLMPYETLINPTAVRSNPLHFPWAQVKIELDKLEALGSEYIGRRLYMMYNPVTGRTNGITPNFFATMTIRPPKIVDRPHRHVSAAINYYFSGSGYSMVAGNRYEWKAGDLMLSAPGWAVHNHASYDDYVYELTIQDQPLNICMESLLWQESLKDAPALLGTESGFRTNRDKALA